MRLLATLGIRVISNMAKSKIDEVSVEERTAHAFKCYARALRELEDCESILRDAWASISCIRGLLQEQTAVMTSSAEIFEV